MSRFSGPQPGAKGTHGKTKGIMLRWRQKRHDEAEVRQEEHDKLVARTKKESVDEEHL